MTTNAVITIYHEQPDQETRSMVFVRHFVGHAHWFTRQETIVNDTGLKSADHYFIRIPGEECSGYLQPHEYLEDPDDHWTVDNGDYIVCGTGPASISKVSELRGYQVCRVQSWSDNRHGLNPHLRIGGA